MPAPDRFQRDPYAVLGLAPDADDVVVRAAYAALLRKHHPDVSPDPEAAARTRAITEAFHLIGTPAARAAFHQQRAAMAVRSMPGRPFIPPPPPRRRGCIAALAVLLVLALAAAGVILLAFRFGDAVQLPGRDFPLAAEMPAAPAEPNAAPPLDPAALDRSIDRAVALVRAGNYARIDRVSGACFDHAAADWKAIDSCIAFDLAAAAADQALGTPRGANYSGIQVATDLVDTRYTCMGLTGDTEERLASIKAEVAVRTRMLRGRR